MISGKVECEAPAVARAREIARHGSNRRHRKNKYTLTFLLKEAKDELLRISRGTLFHNEDAA